MKFLILTICFLFFTFAAFGQQTKTPIDSFNFDTIEKTLELITGLQNDRRKLLEEFKPSAPEVQEVDRRIASLKENIAKIKAKLPPAQLARVDKLISLYSKKADLTEKRQTLLTRYNAEYREVQAVTAQIQSIDDEISLLKLNNNVLSPENLPNDQIYLLKIIVIQNQRIIELLEKRKP